MLVANSFDLWQRDTFFSAAEEVQKSTDVMESAYRAWLRERKQGIRPQFWDDLSRELQMALGTAKWQLEEFEKAVGLSYRRNADEIAMIRHKQFVSAIQEQISLVEESLRESFDANGEQPLRWVNLDENERDDLALFLLGNLESSQSTKQATDDLVSNISGSPQRRTRKHCNGNTEVGAEGQKPKLAYSSGNIACHGDELDGKSSPGERDNVSCQQDIHVQKARSSLDLGVLEIVIDARDAPGETLPPNIEATPKEKGLKPGFWRLKWEDLPQPRGETFGSTRWKRIHWMNQLFGRAARSQRQVQTHQLPWNCSIRFTLVFMLAIFLVACCGFFNVLGCGNGFNILLDITTCFQKCLFYFIQTKQTLNLTDGEKTKQVIVVFLRHIVFVCIFILTSASGPLQRSLKRVPFRLQESKEDH